MVNLKEQLQKEYEMLEQTKDLNLIHIYRFVDRIDEQIGGITGIKYKTGKLMTVANHTDCYSFNPGDEKIAENLAAALYYKAKYNGSIKPGEIHISKKCSTKHHNLGFNDRFAALREHYLQERRAA